MTSKEESISHTTWNGRTIVDVNKLLRDPKVKQILATVSRKVAEGDRRRAELAKGKPPA